MSRISFSILPQCVLWQWGTVWSVSKSSLSTTKKAQHTATQPCPVLCLEQPSLWRHRQVIQSVILHIFYTSNLFTVFILLSPKSLLYITIYGGLFGPIYIVHNIANQQSAIAVVIIWVILTFLIIAVFCLTVFPPVLACRPEEALPFVLLANNNQVLLH